MTAREAIDWLIERGVSRETLGDFQILLRMISDEPHNLIARSTMDRFLGRHIVDSVQLLEHGAADGTWIDIGSGGGFPGIPIAMMRPAPMLLVEPRRLRAEFLRTVVARFNLANVVVAPVSAARVTRQTAATISARAVAPLADLFAMAEHLADARTRWVLPKGRRVREEVEIARRSWHARIELVPSVTDEDAMIVVADQVARKRTHGR